MNQAHKELPRFDFAGRRERFLASLDEGLAVLRAPALARHANDVEYRYRPNADFFYLTGFQEPETVAVFDGSGESERFILFVAPRDPEREAWTGPRAGIEGACEEFGADAAYPLDELESRLPVLIGKSRELYYPLGSAPEFDPELMRLAGSGWARRPRSAAGTPSSVIDPRPIVHEMRLFKSEEELAWMRASIAIAAEAHREAMGQTRPGKTEYEIEALLEYVFRRRGAEGWAYPSIVAGGENATVLHYIANTEALRGGDLLLIDAGCALGPYCADITRTFPVGDDFTKAQAQIYDLVLAAQKASIDEVKPGSTVDAVHKASVEILADGLLSLGLVEGSLQEVIDGSLYQPWYMHRTSHWLGMDVHDVGAYEIDRQPRPLEPGMILTVEPGLYFSPSTAGTPAEYKGIGVRIEDDVLVTTEGCEVLSHRVPKGRDEILSLRAAAF